MTIIVNPDSKDPLDGARERLKRADENIRNLNVEVREFLSSVPKVTFRLGENNLVIDNYDRKAFQEIRERALAGKVIPRLSVLAGEIVHHFRSAFDHVIWQVSTDEGRRRFANEIEFPVAEAPPECIRKPDGKVKHSAFCRKVQGVSSVTALTRIDSLQPYKRVGLDRFNSPLLQIHLLDKFDKHRELVDVMLQPFARAVSQEFHTVNTLKDSASGGFRIVSSTGPPKVKVYAEMFIEVAFTQLREWEAQPLIPFLQNLFRFTSDTVESFADGFGQDGTFAEF
jgi:hypothetical protein